MFRSRPGFRRRTAAGTRLLLGLPSLLALVLGTSGCDGNVACVFADGCRGGSDGGAAGQPATLPENGRWIKDPLPAVVDVFPSGDAETSTAPVVVTFSESMNPQTTLGSVQIVPIAGGVAGTPVPGVSQALVGEDRVLVLLPPSGLPVVDEYEVRFAENAAPTDLTGQAVGDAAGTRIGSFTVAEEDPTIPSVVTTWPAGGATRQGETSEVVVVFDRAVDPTTVDNDSFDVTVDGGQPAEDPPPTALTIDVGGIGVPDNRVFLWRSVDAKGVPASLGIDVPVKVKLSPEGNRIEDLDGNALPATNATFQTNDLGAPLESHLLSNPTDAIGLANLTAGDPEELLFEVNLVNGEEGDRLDIFLFGMSTGEEPQLVALARNVTLAGTPPILTVQVTLDDVNILASASPITPRFADGAVSFAFSLRRGSNVTPLQVIDVDSVATGIQDLILDTEAPVIEELSYTGGATDFFRSDQRDIVLTGKSNEPLRSVEVDTPLGATASGAPVVGSNEAGYFVAAPVPAGVLPTGATTYTAVGYDGALNPSDPVSGSFTQLGAVGPGLLLAGFPVEVQVFDATTMTPLAGALVITHGDDGDGVGYPFVASVVTDASGEATVDSYASGRTILSVDVPGYDLFTFHGLTAARISVPLTPIGTGPSAFVEGAAGTDDPLAALTLTLLNSKVADSRRPADDSRFFDGEACFNLPFSNDLTCPFGPDPIFPDRLGAQSWLAGAFQQPDGNPLGLIQAFDLLIPTSPARANDTDVTSVWIPRVFGDPSTPLDELPIALPSVGLLGAATLGIDLGNLVGDPLTTGVPRITVETVSPGIPGAIPVGLGVSLEQTSNVWLVTAAHPGAVGEGGYFGLRGIVDPDVFLRAEIRDTAGNRAGQRPRVSALPDLTVPDTLVPANVPQLTSPLDGGASGGASYDLEFDDRVPDAIGQAVLYRVRLIDATGRGWTLWRPDPPDAQGPVVAVRVPDLSEGGGQLLANGTITATVSLFGLPDRALDEFLWSDIPREHDLFAHSAPIAYSQP